MLLKLINRKLCYKNTLDFFYTNIYTRKKIVYSVKELLDWSTNYFLSYCSEIMPFRINENERNSCDVIYFHRSYVSCEISFCHQKLWYIIIYINTRITFATHMSIIFIKVSLQWIQSVAIIRLYIHNYDPGRPFRRLESSKSDSISVGI